ncbi:MFS transporter [Paenibacillus sp. JTLBN-2024]
MNSTLRKDYQGNRQQPVTVIAIVTALCLLGDSMLYIVLPIYWKEAGLTALWEVGLLLSINRFVRLPITPLIGLLYRKLPLRVGLAFAVLLASVTTVGYGVLNGFAAWLVLRCLWGIAWSFLRMGSYLTVIRYSDDSNRGHLMGRFNGISRLGSLVGMLAGGILVPITGMDAVSVAFGLFMLAGLPYVALHITGTTDRTANGGDDSHQQKDRGNLRENVWTKPVMKIIATGLLLFLIQTVLTSTLSLLIETHYAQPMMLIGMIVTSTMLSGVLQAVRWAWEPFLASFVRPMVGRSQGETASFPYIIDRFGGGICTDSVAASRLRLVRGHLVRHGSQYGHHHVTGCFGFGCRPSFFRHRRHDRFFGCCGFGIGDRPDADVFCPQPASRYHVHLHGKRRRFGGAGDMASVKCAVG